MVSLFVCVVDRGENEGEPANEQYYEQVNEDQFRDPEPEGQDLPEGYEDGKFNSTLLMHVSVLVFINTTQWPVL